VEILHLLDNPLCQALQSLRLLQRRTTLNQAECNLLDQHVQTRTPMIIVPTGGTWVVTALPQAHTTGSWRRTAPKHVASVMAAEAAGTIAHMCNAQQLLVLMTRSRLKNKARVARSA
jgi:hypothetical protein